MSELEYVERILAAARAYQAAIAEGRLNVRSEEHSTWANLKASLAPSTAIALCVAWLELQNAADRLHTVSDEKIDGAVAGDPCDGHADLKMDYIITEGVVSTSDINPPTIITVTIGDVTNGCHIHQDGRFETFGNYKPDEAAKVFWDCVSAAATAGCPSQSQIFRDALERVALHDEECSGTDAEKLESCVGIARAALFPAAASTG